LQATAKVRIAAVALLIVSSAVFSSPAAAGNDQVCNISADLALGSDDYPTAVMLHRRLLQSQPNNAVAHYHLGFAYGMTGRDSEELGEYQKAVSLGLREWDLFLDLGLAYLEKRDYPNAIDALQTSVLLGPKHPEAHFNLAIAYEEANRLGEAMREIIAALGMTPADLDMRNTKAIICAELGDLNCARDEWMLLRQMAPNYAPARANLVILMGARPESQPSLRNTVEIPQLIATGIRSGGGE
jgi:Flp pilus assembly protein TadD